MSPPLIVSASRTMMTVSSGRTLIYSRWFVFFATIMVTGRIRFRTRGRGTRAARIWWRVSFLMLLFLFSLVILNGEFSLLSSSSLLDTLKLLLEIFSLLCSLRLFFGLLLLLSNTITFCQAFQSLFLLKLKVKGSPELMFVSDSKCIF